LAASQDESLQLLEGEKCTLLQLPRIIDHEPAALLNGLVAHLDAQVNDG
jgi:hypothetical protein